MVENGKELLPAPGDDKEQEQEPPKKAAVTDSNKESSSEGKKSDLQGMAAGVCIVIYGYIADLKNNGHSSLGNLLFQEMMKMNTAASLASESIGRDRFFENLETGFYSSGRLLVYLEFAASLNINNTLREAIIESVTGIHKIFAASVKTVRAKQPKMAGMAAI